MPFFSYQAIDDRKRRVTGLVEAPSIKAASALLQEKKGLFVIRLAPHRQVLSLSDLTEKFSRVGFKDVTYFTSQLATMINAGLPLISALSILAEQSTNPKMRKVVSDIKRQIEGGSSFAEALERHPNLFSTLYVSLVRAGEAAGKIDDILARLAQTMEETREFKSTVKGAMIYPALIMVAMAIVMAIMVIFVIPKLATLYSEFDLDLPFPTRVLIFISDFVTTKWWLALLIIVGLFIIFAFWRKTPAAKRIFDRISLRIPIFGALKVKVLMAEFCRTLSILINAGVPVIEALSLVKGSLDNLYYQEALEEVITQVKKGSSLAEPISKNPYFPLIVSRMVGIGEQTGKVDETLMKVANYFEVESKHTIKGLTTLIEPLILIVFGIGVGFLVWSVLSPIYQLMGQF